VFPPALKYIERLVRARGHARPLAYYHPNWRRDAAPLLDELGASVDHIEAYAKGGSNEPENLATICAKCNVQKGKLTAQEHLKRHPLKKVKGKHGEPAHWDGLASLFVLLVNENPKLASASERAWAQALTAAWH
jgi:hypothetical protein